MPVQLMRELARVPRITLTMDNAIVLSRFGSIIPRCKLKSKPSAFTGRGSTKCFSGDTPIKREFMTSTGRPLVEVLPSKRRVKLPWRGGLPGGRPNTANSSAPVLAGTDTLHFAFSSD